MQIDILARQPDSELVYFAEDDYLYFHEALCKNGRVCAERF